MAFTVMVRSSTAFIIGSTTEAIFFNETSFAWTPALTSCRTDSIAVSLVRVFVQVLETARTLLNVLVAANLAAAAISAACVASTSVSFVVWLISSQTCLMEGSSPDVRTAFQIHCEIVWIAMH